ncbi:uncharacterized protein LOC119876814 isoform X2 [Canis lupus familiaris]|uniref:uncharacterized protein LOC119876814 isoform X2 n=1 Tax=Canis lupus familiaris TaxID=9615 RepID=UPI0018F582E9|nr:uncharacterized protein LOC119876814 isoform X2 [Canis lupus familiaris]
MANITLAVRQSHRGAHGAERKGGGVGWPRIRRWGRPVGPTSCPCCWPVYRDSLVREGWCPFCSPRCLRWRGGRGRGCPVGWQENQVLWGGILEDQIKGRLGIESVSFSAFRRARISVGPALGGKNGFSLGGGFSVMSCQARMLGTWSGWPSGLSLKITALTCKIIVMAVNKDTVTQTNAQTVNKDIVTQTNVPVWPQRQNRKQPEGLEAGPPYR